jgi:hypothetical protein
MSDYVAALNIKNKTAANNTVNTTIVVNQPIVTPLFLAVTSPLHLGVGS